MRKIFNLCGDVKSKIREKLKYRALPVVLVILLVLFTIFCAAAAELTSDSTEKESALPLSVSMLGSVEGVDAERVTVNVVYGGNEYATCNSTVITVSEFLEKIGIKLGAKESASVALDSLIYDGLTVIVGEYAKETVVEDVVVPYSTDIKASQEIPKGDVIVEVKGKNGLKRVTREVVTIGGIVVSDTVVSDVTLNEVVDEVHTEGVGGSVVSNDGTVYTYSYYIDVIATAYHTGGITATGHVANEEVVAVDPKVIPYGTKMYINGIWGEVGYRSAEDCGNFKGKRIDVCMEGTTQELLEFGKRYMRVYILE